MSEQVTLAERFPFQCRVIRRVTDEESVEFAIFRADRDEALGDMARVLADLRAHRTEHNKLVVETMEKQVLTIERRIEDRGERCRALEAEIDGKMRDLEALEAQLKKKRARLNVA